MSVAAWISDRADEHCDADALSLIDLLPSRDPVFDEALCRGTDPDVFFPDRGQSRVVSLITRACQACPARVECALLGLSNNELHGCWGGLMASARRVLRRTGQYSSSLMFVLYDDASERLLIEDTDPPTRDEALSMIDEAAALHRDACRADWLADCADARLRCDLPRAKGPPGGGEGRSVLGELGASAQATSGSSATMGATLEVPPPTPDDQGNRPGHCRFRPRRRWSPVDPSPAERAVPTERQRVLIPWQV